MVVENVAQDFTTIDNVESVIMLCKNSQGDNIAVKCDILKGTMPQILFCPKIGADLQMNVDGVLQMDIDANITEVTFHSIKDEWDDPNEELEDFLKHFVKE